MAAIYQWFEGVIEVQIWTTTLYPIEAEEGIKFDISVSGIAFDTIDNDSIEHTMSLISIDKFLALLEAPEQNDSIEHTVSLIDMDKYVALVEAPEQDDSIEQVVTLIDIVKESKLITIYSPDHGLLFDIDLNSSNCSMDSV